MQLKKIALVFLVVIMMFSLAAISIAAEGAGSEFSFSAKVESDSALSKDPLAVKPGDIIKFIVSVDSNPGNLKYIDVDVDYDSAALEFLGFEANDFGDIFEKNAEASKWTPRYKSDSVGLWFMANEQAYASNKTGMFLTFRFEVKDGFDGDIEKFNVSKLKYSTFADRYGTQASVPELPAMKAHNYGEPTDEAGNCVTSANKVYTCTHEGCDEVLKVPTGELGGHKCETLAEAIAPTCVKAGQVAHYVCANEGCGKYIAEDKTTVLASVEVAIDPNAHKCETLVEAITPDCLTPGQKAYYVCANEGCGKNIAEDKTTVIEDLVVPATGHKCDELVPAVAPGCESEGNVAYYICGNDGCGKFIAEDTTTILETVVVAPAGHNYGNLVAKVPATTEKEGAKAHYLCSVCGKYFDESKVEMDSIVIPKLPKMISVPEDSVWVKGSDVSLSFVSNAKFEDFVSVKLNGEILAETDYKLEKTEDGSTKITLEPATLDKLEAADYTVTITSANGSCDAGFTVENSSAALAIIIVVIAVVVIVAGAAAAIVVLKKKNII